MQVPWLERRNLVRGIRRLAVVIADGDGGRVHAGDDAVALGEDDDPESTAHLCSIPVPTIGASGRSSGTA